jgi:pimeloyl-ACP methyl ester carboxylesterase
MAKIVEKRSMWRIFFAILLLLGLYGCTSHPQEHFYNGESLDIRLHTIYIDGDGNLLDPISKKNVAGDRAFQGSQSSEQTYVNAILSNFAVKKERNPNLKMVVFVHGGLNDFDSATSRPVKATKAMLDDDRYPVFICWDSAFMPSYVDHLWRIRKGIVRTVQGPLSSPFVLLEDLGRSVVRIPSSTYKEVADPIIVSKRINSSTETDYQLRVDRLPAMGFDINNQGKHTGVGSDYYTVWNPIKVLMAPLVDGFGTGAWEGMLRRTDLVLTKNSAFEGDIANANIPVNVSKSLRPDDTAAALFLHGYESGELTRSQPIELIGHSMGAIVAINIMARHAELKIDNVVFMGAAARIKEVENVVVPWLQRNPGSQFWNLSLDPYREMGENTFYDFMPRGSLLNWIDFTFGEVNSFKDRTAGSWWNITRLAEDVFPGDAKQKELRQRVHLTRFPISNNGSWPQRHGEFADYKFWRIAYWEASSSEKLEQQD